MVTLGEQQSISISTCHDLSDLKYEQLQPGKYVACIYDIEWYVGSIVEWSDEHNDVLVDFMRRSATGLFPWPAHTRKDRCWVPFQYVICIIIAPELHGQSAPSYNLNSEDVNQIQEIANIFVILLY